MKLRTGVQCLLSRKGIARKERFYLTYWEKCGGLLEIDSLTAELQILFVARIKVKRVTNANAPVLINIKGDLVSFSRISGRCPKVYQERTLICLLIQRMEMMMRKTKLQMVARSGEGESLAIYDFPSERSFFEWK